ncbi:MAG: phosphoribosylformylglycinamidine synthase subunit PurL [Microthrixaceae bacterium]
MAAESTDETTHLALGLTDDEFETIVEILGRRPNHLELAMFSVMWSEHCSYKSSRIHLRRFPTKAPWVLVGPGEGAGVVDVGDGIAVAIRIESHNHPSAIEPDQGAATGAGGILRDIFSMGARPIALMDPLRFGPLDDARSRWIAEGVVSGISGYGNSVGVPTIGGETVFDECYADNPLVNVLALGVMPAERLVLGRAEGVGNLAVLLGSTTGRDGIGGVSVLASAGFSDEESDAEKRPSVQVGDPYEEKRLIEACLELLEKNLATGVQDLGGAGITCATAETAAKGGAGMDVNVDSVHLREANMEPFEVMTSESQERMLAIVEPSNLDAVLKIAAEWEVSASVIGTVTDSGCLRVLNDSGEVLCDVPAKALEEDAPLYDRDLRPPADLAERRADSASSLPAPVDAGADLMGMLSDFSWVYSQYDHMLFLNTVVAPGGDAAVLRLKDPRTNLDTGKGLAVTTDGNHLWCAVDPRVGSAMTVAESVMNLAAVGAHPIALVNCLNFGNPEHPEVMWQLSESIDGISEALDAFGVPCIGGNVSLYNESRGRDIDPTPVLGVLGLIDELRKPPGVGLVDGSELILIGETDPELAGSQWAALHGHRGRGTLPAVDLDKVAAAASVLRKLVHDGLLDGVHDVSTGGVALALGEMAVASSVGFVVNGIDSHGQLFSESAGRAVISVSEANRAAVAELLDASGVEWESLGRAGGDRLTVQGQLDISLGVAQGQWTGTLPDALGSGTVQDSAH